MDYISEANKFMYDDNYIAESDENLMKLFDLKAVAEFFNIKDPKHIYEITHDGRRLHVGAKAPATWRGSNELEDVSGDIQLSKQECLRQLGK